MYYQSDNPPNLTKEQIERVKLISYYGWGYKEHTDLKWYAITQFMIWEESYPYATYYFSNTLGGPKVIKYTEEINEIEDGIWLVDAMAFPCPNYLEMAGCAVINATSIYPNMDLWKNLDKNGEYEEVYNRYAHVYMEIRRQEDISEKFILLSKDSIQVFITPEELEKLNIKYIFTVRVMEEFETENLSFELIYNENSYHIYKVNYK